MSTRRDVPEMVRGMGLVKKARALANKERQTVSVEPGATG